MTNDPAAALQDLEQIVLGKAKQLSDRIDDFRAGHYTFGGATATDLPVIQPIMVTGEPVPMWTAAMRPINAAIAKAGYLQQPRVEPLSIIGIDELEMLEALSRVSSYWPFFEPTRRIHTHFRGARSGTRPRYRRLAAGGAGGVERRGRRGAARHLHRRDSRRKLTRVVDPPFIVDGEESQP